MKKLGLLGFRCALFALATVVLLAQSSNPRQGPLALRIDF
jgi:hypothetical protein